MLRIFVNTWGNYNENGADGGEWIELPMDDDELTEKLEAIASAMGDGDPEWTIHDYEWTGDIKLGSVDEMDRIEVWNERCQEADELNDYDLMEIAAAMEAFGYDFAEAMQRQKDGYFTFYPGQDLSDVAHDLVNECYFTRDTPKVLMDYFDYEAFARDLRYDGYTETDHGVICDN